MGQLNCDHIKLLTTLTSDYINCFHCNNVWFDKKSGKTGKNKLSFFNSFHWCQSIISLSDVRLWLCVTTDIYLWCVMTPSRICAWSHYHGSMYFADCTLTSLWGQTILKDQTNWMKTDLRHITDQNISYNS